MKLHFTLMICLVNLVNLILFLVGGGVMSFGIIALANPQLIIDAFSYIPGFDSIQFIINIDQAITSNGIMLTCVGAVIVFICLLGLFGACCKSKIMIGTYVGLVLLVLLFEIAVIIYSAVDYTGIESRVQALMLSSLIANFAPVNISSTGAIINSTEPAALAWETLQFEYSCCGASGYKDFESFNWDRDFPGVSVPNATVPPSCCMEPLQYQVASSTSSFVNLTGCLLSAPLYTNVQGCYVPMMQKISEYSYISVIILCGLIVIEVCVMMMSMHMVVKVDKEKDRL